VSFDDTTDTYTYEPQAGYTGEDSFTYSFTDGEIDYSGQEPVAVLGQDTFDITVGNIAPTASNEGDNTHMSDTLSGIDLLSFVTLQRPRQLHILFY